MFAVDYIFFGINVITIGYYTSIERINLAMRLTLLRGILLVLFFFILPAWFGVTGIWLAVAAGDITTTVVIVFLNLKDKNSKKGTSNVDDHFREVTKMIEIGKRSVSK